MRLSVIIPCLNAANTIGGQLEALANQDWSEPWEVIVADNGSTDDSVRIVERFRERVPKLRTVDSSDRRGAAYARNVGAQAATGEAFVFCDADDEVGPGWLAAMGEALCKHDFVANRMNFEKLNAPWVAKVFKNHPQTNGLQRVWYPPYLLHAGGGGLGIKRSLHESIGGFDESLMRLMDTDYCFRVQHAGTKLHFVPNALMHVRCQEDAKARFHQARLWAPIQRTRLPLRTMTIVQLSALVPLPRTLLKPPPQQLSQFPYRLLLVWMLLQPIRSRVLPPDQALTTL